MEVSKFSPKLQFRLLLFLAFIICGSIALPMLPIWQGAVRGLIAVLLISHVCSPAYRLSLFVLLLGLASYASGSWLLHLFSQPSSHVIHALTDVYGQPLDVTSDGLLLLFDVVCVFGVSWILVSRYKTRDRLLTVFIASLALFWTSALLKPILQLMDSSDNGNIAQMMTGTSGWASWVYWAFAAILLIRSERDVRLILKAISYGAGVIGVIVALQWVIGDFSYVLDSINYSDYFYRVRGTSYYHAPATFSLLVAGGAFLAFAFKKEYFSKWSLVCVFFIIILAFANGTRALNLALLCGSTLFALASLRFKYYKICTVAMMLATVLSMNIFYVKPVSGLTTTVGTLEETRGTGASEVDLEKLATANASRSLLAFSSLEVLSSLVWSGSGVGTLELPLTGNAFNGLKSTYSTHILFLDVMLMAGGTALFFMLVMYGLAVLRLLSSSFRNIDSTSSYRAPALLAILVMFGIGSFFLPQERNEIIGLSFMMAALAMLKVEESETPEVLPVFKKVGIFVMLLGALVWSFLTSPVYVFPAIEFAARYGESVKDNHEEVFVTEPMMRPILSAVLYLKGVKNPNVSVLRDELENLPQNNAWILWSPTNDHNYAKLRDELGYQLYRIGGQAPSLYLPPSWWVMPSSQPVVNFLYVGARALIPVPLQEVGSVTMGTGVTRVLQRKNEAYGDTHYLVDSNAKWTVDFSPRLPKASTIDIYINSESNPEKGEYLYNSIYVDGELGSELTFDVQNLPVGSTVKLESMFKLLPNRAYEAKITQFPSGISGVSVADLNYGTGVTWDAKVGNSFLFKFNSSLTHPLGVYRMTALNWRGANLRSEYSWTVEGSQDAINWQLLDTRNDVILSQSSESPSTFALPKSKGFKYYRFNFPPYIKNKEADSGLLEIEIYPIAE